MVALFCDGALCSNSAMRRSFRRVIATLTVCWLLFAQGAMAAHTCSLMLDPSGGLVPVASTNPPPEECAGMMDQAAAALCLKHCSQGNDATNTAFAVDVPAPALIGFLVVESAPAEASAVRSWAAPRPAAHNNSPPPLLLSQRLRI